MSRIAWFLLISIALLLTACASQSASGMEPPVSVAGPVRDAYLYAIPHPEELAKYPCHCGCDTMGHENNQQCFVQETNADGTFVFDLLGTGCGVCVYTALDVRNMTDAGVSEEEIFAHINRTYKS